MLKCSSCSGFIPSSASSCPHCQASCGAESVVNRTLRMAKLGLIATGASMTLMACYGLPPDYVDDSGTGGWGSGSGSASSSGGAAAGGHTSSGGQVSSDGGNGPLGGTAGALGGQGGAADLGGQGGQQ